MKNIVNSNPKFDILYKTMIKSVVPSLLGSTHSMSVFYSVYYIISIGASRSRPLVNDVVLILYS